MYEMIEGRNIDEDIRNTQAEKSAGVAGWLKMPLPQRIVSKIKIVNNFNEKKAWAWDLPILAGLVLAEVEEVKAQGGEAGLVLAEVEEVVVRLQLASAQVREVIGEEATASEVEELKVGLGLAGGDRLRGYSLVANLKLLAGRGPAGLEVVVEEVAEGQAGLSWAGIQTWMVGIEIDIDIDAVLRLELEVKVELGCHNGNEHYG
ncbi:hypothetical protein PPACK8108_LOCUS10006 [Phakopsora pachyrhizi]|uniref:Uncharacterized protein n=1 Tax=Phakopsora pachyrhizi TaxID=170000 RepID=A0AAV0AZH9_PHAPC|nr:hypothetical protein PPACK8108_LOCUS10006 [Phakopsora pachyrhizi]